MRGGPHQRRKRRRWHRNPRGTSFARHLGRQSEIKRKETEIRRLESLIAEDERKRAEASDRALYHEMRIAYCEDRCNI